MPAADAPRAQGKAAGQSGEGKRHGGARKNDLNLHKNNLKIELFSIIIEQDIL